MPPAPPDPEEHDAGASATLGADDGGRNHEPLDAAAVLHVAKLSRLAMNEDEAARFAQQLEAVLGYIDTLHEANTQGVEPLLHPLDLVNAFRPDAPGPMLPVDTALRNAPDREGDFFAVPKVLGGGGA